MARHSCRSRSQSRSAKGEGKQKGKGKDEEPPNVAHTSLVYALNSAQQNNSERIQTPWTEATYVGLVRQKLCIACITASYFGHDRWI